MVKKFEDDVSNNTILDEDSLIQKLHRIQMRGDDVGKIEILLGLSQIYYDSQRYVKAKSSLNKILKINNHQVNINYYLGLIELELDNYDGALIYFKKELKINPKNKLVISIIEKINVKNNFPILTFFIFAINLILFFLYSNPEINLINAIKYSLSLSVFSYSNLLTSLFIHINLFHFMSNMAFLLLFGLILEKQIGSLKFLMIYLFSGMIGNFFESFFSPNIMVLGASSALFGVMGSIMLLQPLLKLRVFGIFKVPIIIVLGFLFFVSSLFGIFFPNQLIQGDIAHLFGFLVGVLIIGIMYFEKQLIFYNWIFIFFGFFLIKFGIMNLIDGMFLISFLYFVVGLFSIIYSYSLLKSMYNIEV